MKAVVLAAGRGTRLAPYSAIVPKPLMPVGLDASGAFEPILDRLLGQLRRAGVVEVAIAVNYLAEAILRHAGDGSRYGLKLSYVYQEKLDGNAGAFWRAAHLVQGDDVIVTDADNLISDDEVFAVMAEAHRRAGAAITVGVCEVERIEKFAIIKTDPSGRAVDIFEKPADRATWGNLAKSGFMILSPEVVALDPSVSLAPNGEFTTTGIVKHCIESGRKVLLHRVDGGFQDIGTWDEYIGVFVARLARRG
jgi:NDP-sugar pyrophosphorylase family protein